MSVFGNKESQAADDETRADRVMGRDDAEPTQQLDAAGRHGAGASAGTGRGATSTGGSTAATSPAAPRPDIRSRESYGEDQDERTRVQPIPSAGAGAGRRAIGEDETATRATATGATATGTARGSRAHTAAEDDSAADLTAERERRRAERDQALGTRRKAAEEPEPVVVEKPRRTTDKFFGSLGLFLLRLVTAAVVGLHGLWKVMNLSKVEQMLTNTVIPEPHIMSYVLAAAEIAIALGLLFGMLTRLAGLGLALVGIGALVFVKWVSNPFTGYQLGGELELLLGALGILFLLLGAGGWSVDAAFRRRRAASKRV